MKSNVFFVLFISFSVLSFAQKGQFSGQIKDAKGNYISYCKITFYPSDKTLYTDGSGYFMSQKLDYGSYSLRIEAENYRVLESNYELKTSIYDLGEIILKKSLSVDLDEVSVTRKKNNSFFIRRMKAIEGDILTQGKKTEVISLETIDANKATNTSRQIFARVPGLNIWESDGSGIQIGLGGRGLNPSRNVNFNTRQNGYDISADALGYPESYYTPPSEAVEEIQMIRGAASLQFGPQFGGLINYKLKKGVKDKKAEIIARHTIGSFGLNNSYLSISGTINSWSYIAYGNYKFGDDWRPNSSFKSVQGHVSLSKKITRKTSLEIEFTKMYYLAQQPGGLTDNLFNSNPDTSLRERNWFRVNWNMAALNIQHTFSSNASLSSKTFGLIASRESLGYLDQINRIDPIYTDPTKAGRNLISGIFQNIGNETRYIQKYRALNQPWAFVSGIRIYKGYSENRQGAANREYGPDFYFVGLDGNATNANVNTDYQFPSFNLALFGEHIFNLTKKLSITPGIRYEYISTNANGSYRYTNFDLAGNIVFDTLFNSDRSSNRDFAIGGIGITFKATKDIELYSNFSQNYRSIHFTEMQIQNPNFKIDPDLQDETGFNSDLGIRGQISNKLFFDASIYAMYYNNRIGTSLEVDPVLFSTFQYRTNVSAARTYGLECIAEVDWWKVFVSDTAAIRLSTFANFSYNNARYVESKEPAFQNKKVELVPPVVLKTGLTIGNQRFSVSYQYSFTQEHFSDATNSTSQANAVNGLIPSYAIMDLSGKAVFGRFQLEAGINNLANASYFTRRAVAYPGPGIIPGAARNFYLTLQVKI